MAAHSARLLIAALAVALAACGKSPPPFDREGGTWRYRGTPVAGADHASFAPLSDHYAKDRARVYYADTYRDGKEYYSVAHPRVAVIEGADAATFKVIERGYARDATHVYFEGERHAVKDIGTFALLDYVFARDSATAYCHMEPIAGSDPASFTVLSGHYARDRTRVYWCDIEINDASRSPYVKVIPIDADVGSFALTDLSDTNADAKDARGRFSRGKRLP